MKSVLIANRGEIAIRIAHSLADRGLTCVAVQGADEETPLHARHADHLEVLAKTGVAAYLDSEGILAAARASGVDGVHPGYGFLSENAAFARALEEAGLVFIGPAPETLDQLGNKSAARRLAKANGVPVAEGPDADGPEAAGDFMAQTGGAVVLKAVSGGGGRGMRVVHKPDELAALWEEASTEAERAFGDGRLYVERYIPQARHIEVQLAGDGTDVLHLWERDCSLQRRHQKVMEVAPAVGLDPVVRDTMLAHAENVGRAAKLRGLATMEFLVGSGGELAFIEANPRLQVEHTITEAVTGLDLVGLQLDLASGGSLSDLGLTVGTRPVPSGTAIQMRVTLERIHADGAPRPATGTITAFEMPGGPGVRVDHAGHAGLEITGQFDSLIAKLVVHGPQGMEQALLRARRALSATRIAGVDSNLSFLRALAEREEVASGGATTQFIDRHAAALAGAAQAAGGILPPMDRQPADTGAVDAHVPDGALVSPVQGEVIDLPVETGAQVVAGQHLATIEAMKMQHRLTAFSDGRVSAVCANVGDVVREGAAVVVLEALGAGAADEQPGVDLDAIPPQLAELYARQSLLQDSARPEAVARRHDRGGRMPRENLAELFDDGAFTEHGGFVVAAQKGRRTEEDLIRETPADGLVCGIGAVNGARVAAMHYDYTVMAGTQGVMNHHKTDRFIDMIAQARLPAVFYTEGGGGRPGDVDVTTIAGLDCESFRSWARLSGAVPLVGIVNGRCFAGNAALLGMCDVVIATRSATIGMGGPAMIEGGGLGRFAAEEVGPAAVHTANGVIDILVEDEAQATAVARKWLAFFQGRSQDRTAPDPRRARHVVPVDRLTVYDGHEAVDALVDEGSFVEIRAAFAPGVIAGLGCIDGWPVGIIASNPMHLAGAITSDGADKVARFMQLCEAHGLPVLSLVDTPGMMVGPDVERTALVRHCARLFVTGAALTVPVYAVVMRKAYGLGAMALVGGSMKAPELALAWPTAEFGAMGLEGAVRLGWRKQLEEAGQSGPEVQKALFDQLVAKAYQRGRALNVAAHHEIDTVIDPAETRAVLAPALAHHASTVRERAPKRFVDTW